MLENNTYRLVLLMGGLGVLATLILLVLVAPVIAIAPEDKLAFELIMNKDLGDATAVTIYDAAWYAVKGWIRGDISHY